ncbi:hypothetical protein BC938DRAFT_472127 [Jimgerdemannia flammicorona]|uniref:Uncharacterized protein n=1 Tax=Jimgerdemannia flammicorona TaxID=994334 RepID=A0A433Q6R8_9FUNG|nr:hypothetical protein BC938DRAFT_472127 [Jimgerdemannia flammicorona]
MTATLSPDLLKNEKANRANDLACLDITQPGDIGEHLYSVAKLCEVTKNSCPPILTCNPLYLSKRQQDRPSAHALCTLEPPSGAAASAPSSAQAAVRRRLHSGRARVPPDRLLASISTALAVYGNYADEVDQLGRTVREIQARIVSGEV